MKKQIDISAIIIYYEKYSYDDVNEIHKAYKASLEAANLNYEFIYVVDGNLPNVINKLTNLYKSGEKIKVVKLGKWFGDATALQVGFEQSSGELILTLPSYQQVDEKDIPKLLNAIDSKDMVVTWRYPRLDGFLNNIQSKAFNKIIKWIVGADFHDLKSIVKVFRREVLEKIYMYGDQDRFLPLLANKYGFKIEEVKVNQAKKDAVQKFYPFSNYIARFLELISIFFLVKFTKKPIRFFGSTGLITFSMGFILAVILFVERVFLGVPLADRPIVLVSILLMIFGVQSFAIGLVGELIIFTHAKDVKDYIIESVIDYENPILNQEIRTLYPEQVEKG
jgi:glycosyltransferase involved in cell wall biosynthesis